MEQSMNLTHRKSQLRTFMNVSSFIVGPTMSVAQKVKLPIERKHCFNSPQPCCVELSQVYNIWQRGWLMEQSMNLIHRKSQLRTFMNISSFIVWPTMSVAQKVKLTIETKRCFNSPWPRKFFEA